MEGLHRTPNSLLRTESMSEIFDTLETGEHCLLKIPELDYPLILPWVWLLGEEQDTQIASLNLIGKIGWNQDLGRLIAQRIRQTLPNLEGLCFVTIVEKALQLAQVVASELNVKEMAIAYNRVKPHMEATRRPVIQVGTDSVTSGVKFLAFYERDINLLETAASRGVVIIDDVVTTGGTIFGLIDLLDQLAHLKKLQHPSPSMASFVSQKKERKNGSFLPLSIPLLGFPILSLGDRGP